MPRKCRASACECSGTTPGLLVSPASIRARFAPMKDQRMAGFRRSRPFCRIAANSRPRRAMRPIRGGFISARPNRRSRARSSDPPPTPTRRIGPRSGEPGSAGRSGQLQSRLWSLWALAMLAPEPDLLSRCGYAPSGDRHFEPRRAWLGGKSRRRLCAGDARPSGLGRAYGHPAHGIPATAARRA